LSYGWNYRQIVRQPLILKLKSPRDNGAIVWHVDCYIRQQLRANEPQRTQTEKGKQMKNLLKRLWQEEEGQDLVEYGLLLVLVSLGAVAAMGTLASAISNAFGNASKNLSSS
jgi:pilus assembly protein Flp/PilA